MEQLFLDGTPPDFSLLQWLLWLEAELGPPLLPPPAPGEVPSSDLRARRGEVVAERPPGPCNPPPPPPGGGLCFLQESARLLDPPRSPPLPPPDDPPQRPGTPPDPRDGPDALSLISLQCQRLASNGDGTGTINDTGNGTGTNNGTNNGTGSGTGTNNGTGNGTGSSSGARSGTDNGTGTSNGAGSGTGNGTGTNNGTGTSKGPGSGTGTGAGTYKDTGTSKGPGSGPGTAPVSGSSRRKLTAPRRGAEPWDPQFRGVTLSMRLGPPQAGAEGCTLLIATRASRIPPRPPPAKPPRAGGSSSSSEDDTPQPLPTQGPKRCASCKTLRTPLWRAAENGTVLCNACGIRYRKYRVRCPRCWTIPGKSGTPHPQCPHCGERCHPAGGGRK